MLLLFTHQPDLLQVSRLCLRHMRVAALVCWPAASQRTWPRLQHSESPSRCCSATPSTPCRRKALCSPSLKQFWQQSRQRCAYAATVAAPWPSDGLTASSWHLPEGCWHPRTCLLRGVSGIGVQRQPVPAPPADMHGCQPGIQGRYCPLGVVCRPACVTWWRQRRVQQHWSSLSRLTWPLRRLTMTNRQVSGAVPAEEATWNAAAWACTTR